MTNNKDLTNGAWVLVTSAAEFLVQNQTDDLIYVRFDTSLPTNGTNDAYIELKPKQAIVRNGLTGNLYGYTNRADVSLSVSE